MVQQMAKQCAFEQKKKSMCVYSVLLIEAADSKNLESSLSHMHTSYVPYYKGLNWNQTTGLAQTSGRFVWNRLVSSSE